MKRICVCTGNRAETGLIAPLQRLIAAQNDMELFTLEVNGLDFVQSFYLANRYFGAVKDIDIALVPCDRPEMLACALAAFFNNVPVAHYGAGDSSEDGCHTGRIRHLISMVSDIMFVKSEERGKRLVGMGIDPGKIFIINSTAFDDVVLDESKLPSRQFDIISYHPPTMCLDRMGKELQELGKYVRKAERDGIYLFWINPNGDPGSDRITAYAKRLGYAPEGLPRERFLGLLKNCRRIVGNSSCLIYEAPYYLKPEQIMHIGVRNRGRDTAVLRPGGSGQMFEALRRWDRGKRKVLPVGKILASKITDLSQ